MVPEGGSIVNAMKVAPAQQVMLKIRFLEVARSASREIGVNLVCGKQHDSGLSLIWTMDGTTITGSACAKAGFQPNVVKEAQESSLIVGLVAAGVGIAVVPATTRCVGLPGVAYRRIKGKDAHSTLYLARRKNDTSVHAKKLLKALRLRRISSASPTT